MFKRSDKSKSGVFIGVVIKKLNLMSFCNEKIDVNGFFCIC